MPTFEIQEYLGKKSTDFEGFYHIKSDPEEVKSSSMLEREFRVPRFMLDLFDRYSGNSRRSPLSSDIIRAIFPLNYGSITILLLNASLNF